MAYRTAIPSPEIEAINAKIPDAPGDVWSNKDQIAEAVLFIAREFQPERIVLFGSRAYGTPTDSSDVDLMVVMDTSLRPADQRDLIRQSLPQESGFSLDIHLRTPGQIALGLEQGDFFIQDVMLQGITLYVGGIMGGANDSDGDASQIWGLQEATRKWLHKADRNADSAFHLLTATNPNWDDVCFLAQQCAEKSLKAVLQEYGVRFPRTHDLPTIANLCEPFAPTLAELQEDLRKLSECAVRSRYPGLDIDEARAKYAIQTMARVQGLARMALSARFSTQTDPG